jgi:phosphoribosylformimino-5-aminoimidazole carboxamide ribotide isomerase
MYLIPAIDLRDGACVRLEQGDFGRHTEYASDPLEIACRFAEHGAVWLHLVDLDGARSGAPKHFDMLERIAHNTELKVEFGGGLRTIDMMRRAFAAGAERVVLGTAALESRDLLEAACAEFGDGVAVGIDARDGLVAVRAWIETSDVQASTLAVAAAQCGARRLIYTDIATDGMLSGPNVRGLRAMVEVSGLPVVASGGVATPDHLRELSAAGAEAAIVGRALYSGGLPLTVLQEWQ